MSDRRPGPGPSEPVGTHVEEEYHGAARLVVDEHEIAVHVRLSGHFEPISGMYQWAGRVEPNPQVSASVRPNAAVRLVTEGGRSADATIREEDPWGGFRVSGSGRPPFAVPTEVG